MDDRLVVTLLRHGITEDNKRRAYIGWADSPLSISGRESLVFLKNELPAPDLLFSSDLVRTVDTAKLLFETEPIQLESLREFHFGDWEGKTFEQLKEDVHYKRWLADFFTVQLPNGEDFQTFTERVMTGWSSIKEAVERSQARRITVVTHGGVIRHLLTMHSPETHGFWDWQVVHGQGYELIWSSARDFKEGKRCTLLQAVPSTEKRNG